MVQWYKRPVVMHGLLGGAVSFAFKLSLYYTGNWFFKLNPYYVMISFLPVGTGMILGSLGEKKLIGNYGYWRALLSCVIVSAIAVAVALLAEQIIYRALDPQLALKTRDQMVVVQEQSFAKMNFLSKSDKSAYLKILMESDPAAMYSLSYFFSGVVTYTILNSMWGFLIAAYTRRRTQPIP